MSTYVAGGLMIMLLLGVTLLGIQVYQVYDAARMVEAALLDAQLKLAADGGVSPQVERLVRQRVRAEGGDPGRLTVTGSAVHTPYGELVTLHVRYSQAYTFTALMPGSGGGEHGLFAIQRSATAMSGWEP
jgi:hypothetical protein